MNKSTDGWVPLSGGSESLLQGLETCMPMAPHSHTSTTPMLPRPIQPQGHTPYMCLHPCSCATLPAPPHPCGTHACAHINFRASFPLPVSGSFGRCLYNLVPPPSLISPQGGVVWTLKSPFSSLFSLATLQHGGPRAVTSFSWTSLSSVCKLELLALPSWPHRAAPAFP